MRFKSAFLLLSAVFMFLSAAMGAATRDIDEVRNKAVLGDKDFKVIDSFVASTVSELLEMETFNSVSTIRNTMLVRRDSSNSASVKQYSMQFAESSYNHLKMAIEDAKLIEDQVRQNKIMLNLLILLNGIEDPRAAILAVPELDNKSKAISYWAVQTVTNEELIKKLNSAGGAQYGEQIIDALSSKVDGAAETSMDRIVRFANAFKSTKAERLLEEIADSRMQKYVAREVENPAVDSSVLQALCEKAVSGAAKQQEFGQQFAQLYSYVIQTYAQGQGKRDTLNQLASVIAETERACVGMQMNNPQAALRLAVQKGDINELMAEHDKLLGGDSVKGFVPDKFGFSYGESGTPAKLPALAGG